MIQKRLKLTFKTLKLPKPYVEAHFQNFFILGALNSKESSSKHFENETSIWNKAELVKIDYETQRWRNDKLSINDVYYERVERRNECFISSQYAKWCEPTVADMFPSGIQIGVKDATAWEKSDASNFRTMILKLLSKYYLPTKFPRYIWQCLPFLVQE